MLSSGKTINPVDGGNLSTGMDIFINLIQRNTMRAGLQGNFLNSVNCSHIARWAKSLFMKLACREMLLASLAVLLSGGLKHD